MHSRLLHGALQKDEARAIVIEVEDDPEEPGEDEEFYAANFGTLDQEDEPEEPGEDEEFYAANFEVLGQEDEEESEEMISEDEALPPDSSDGEHDEEPSP